MIYKHFSYSAGSDDAKFYDKDLTELKNINKIGSYNYASLEPNSYDVNAPRKLYNGEPLGYFSGVLSDNLGQFENQKIFINFGQIINFHGFTLEADNIIEAEIQLYFQDELIKTSYLRISDNNTISIDEIEITEILINITGINAPNRFLNIFGVRFGEMFILNPYIKTVQMINNQSISGRELPIDTLKLSILNPPENLIVENEQKIDVYDDNNILRYSFYVGEYKEKEDLETITYYDSIYLLEEEFVGDFYHNVSLKEIVDEIFKDTGIDYDLLFYADMKVSGHIPTTTKRNALIYLCNATGLKIKKHPKIQFYKPADEKINRAEFNDDNIFQGSYSIERLKPAKEVNLGFYSDKSYESDEYEVIVEQEFEAGTYDVYLDTPIDVSKVIQDGYSKSFIATKINDKNQSVYVSVNKLTSNLVNFTVGEKCNVIIKFKYFYDIDNFTEYSKQIENANLYKNKTIIDIDTFTLMSDPVERLNELFDYYTVNEKTKAKVVWEKPEDFSGYVSFYGIPHRINKLTTSFDGVCELEAERVVE